MALDEINLLKENLRNYDRSFEEKDVASSDQIDEIVQLLCRKKNLILQGAPGTGKTFRIPEIVTRLCGLTKVGDSRDAVLEAYRKLKSEGRVDFTTFHPSLDYENFVEGWQPAEPKQKTGEPADVNSRCDESIGEFEIADGIFKRIADRASRAPSFQDEGKPQGDVKVWKVSLGGTYNNPIRNDCLTNGLIRIDWGGDGEDPQALIAAEEKGHVVLNAFCNRMREGDFVVSCYSKDSTDAIGVVESHYFRLPEAGYRLARKVHWLWRGEPTPVAEDYMNGTTFTSSSVYSITDLFTPERVREFLRKKGQDAVSLEADGRQESLPYILAIDEINRGNISKIFGELITLLEPEKRKGGVDEESCTLPYSKTSFAVPPNLYIIGTMNTADRSIGTLDYALRRRFVFYSLQPKPIEDERFDNALFSAVSGLFVEDPQAEHPVANRETLSEEFDPLDVWPGPSYFLKEEGTCRLRYRYEIRPLLMEYIRDGVLKPSAEGRIRAMEEELDL